MEFFNTLPDELQKIAIQEKQNELYDSWYDSYISEAGDELPFYVEERLLEHLPEVVKDLAKMYYEKQEAENNA